MLNRHAAAAAVRRHRPRLWIALATLMLGAFPTQAADLTPVAGPAPASIFLPAVKWRAGTEVGRPSIFLPQPGYKATSWSDDMPARSTISWTPASASVARERVLPGLVDPVVLLLGAPMRPPARPTPPDLPTAALPTQDEPSPGEPNLGEPTGDRQREEGSTTAGPVTDSRRAAVDSQAERLAVRILAAVKAALAAPQAEPDGAVAKTPLRGAGKLLIPTLPPRRPDHAWLVQARAPARAKARAAAPDNGVVLPPGDTGSDLSRRITRAVRAALIDDGADAAQQDPERPTAPATASPEPARDDAAETSLPASARDALARRVLTIARQVALKPQVALEPQVAADDAMATQAERLSTRIRRAVLAALASRKP